MRRGDILRFKRFYGLFYHYVLYIGNNKVIHLDKANLLIPYGKISINNLNEIIGQMETVPLKLIRVPTEQAIGKALILQDSMKYNILTSNCEHFVNFVRYNKIDSRQITNLKRFFSIGIFTFLSCFNDFTYNFKFYNKKLL